MNLEMIRGKTGYIDTGYGLAAVYRSSETEVILIDSGNKLADEIIALFDSLDLKIGAVVCTHLHYDHTANNNILYDRYNPEIFLYGHDFANFKMRTSPRYPYNIIDPTSDLVIDGISFKIIPTPGHTPDHLAFVTPDDVCCIGDALISQPLLSESKLPYIEDVEQAILTMEEIRRMKYPHFLVCHKGVVLSKDMPSLIDDNIKKELELYDVIRNQISAPTLIEDAVVDFMRQRKISESRIQQSYTMRNTVRARILTLAEAGEFKIEGEYIVPFK